MESKMGLTVRKPVAVNANPVVAPAVSTTLAQQVIHATSQPLSAVTPSSLASTSGVPVADTAAVADAVPSSGEGTISVVPVVAVPLLSTAAAVIPPAVAAPVSAVIAHERSKKEGDVIGRLRGTHVSFL